MIQEKQISTVNGWLALGLLLLGLGGSIYALLGFVNIENVLGGVLSAVALLVVVVCGAGLFVVNPNEAQVIQLLGNYAGTAKRPGLWWTNPFCYPKRKVSQRVRNFESSKLKVNDHDGNPIEIAAVVVWRVEDTAEAVFQVDDYENFVQVQSEAALRNLATSYPVRYARGWSGGAPTEQHGDHRQAAGRDLGAAHPRGNPGDRSAHQPPGLRAGDRQRHAPPSTGWGGGRREGADS